MRENYAKCYEILHCHPKTRRVFHRGYPQCLHHDPLSQICATSFLALASSARRDCAAASSNEDCLRFGKHINFRPVTRYIRSVRFLIHKIDLGYQIEPTGGKRWKELPGDIVGMNIFEFSPLPSLTVMFDHRKLCNSRWPPNLTLLGQGAGASWCLEASCHAPPCHLRCMSS